VELVISKAAGRALQRSNKRKLLTQKILELSENRGGLDANIVRLQGRTDFRLRVQDWRVVFRIEDDTVYIDEIEPRSSIYEDRS
jgi:mRNA interferase RelE/StbE